MEPDNKNSSPLLLVLIGLAIILFGGLYFFNLQSKNSNRSQKSPEITPINKVEELTTKKAPAGFPSNSELPLPVSATISKSYQATSPDGKIQVTEILSSTKSASENFSYFRNLITAKNNDWKLLSELNPSSDSIAKALFAQNSRGILNISISNGIKPDTSIIDLSFSLN